ncbi:BTB/POZ domain-containing protein [Colletotrichum kahawae]|uniref:BTB/POZ domain-containing protein n=1 Tax=Colletotrichum kahawae TaxID=34407 RepID=A0AAE0DD22_COLKA|nr:BTB/POZ domain-containing protein [Colletotrichum kahawae]
MSKDSRWMLQTGKYGDFRLVQDERMIRVHRSILVQHSGYFAKLFKNGIPSRKDANKLRLEIPEEFDLDLVYILKDCLYRGETDWRFPKDDIYKNVQLWILAQWLNIEYAMHTIELNLLEKLSTMKQKYRAAKPWILELVFDHRKCGNSTVGVMFAEAAVAVRYTTGKADHIRCLDELRNIFPALRRSMDEWEVQYREQRDQMLGSGGYGWCDEAVIALQPLRRHMIENHLGIAAEEDVFVTKGMGNSVPLL